MTPTSRYNEAISRLLKETQDGSLKWRLASERYERPTLPYEAQPREVYLAERDSRFIRLTYYQSKGYKDEDDWYWRDEVTLELGTSSQDSWWPFPESKVTWDLLRAVCAQVSDVDGFLDDLLGKK